MIEVNDFVKVTKEFTVKESEGYKLRIKMWKCLAPSDLNSLEFIQETVQDGKVVSDSTYNFFLTDEDVERLCRGLRT